jgi:hypothetical protein
MELKINEGNLQKWLCYIVTLFRLMSLLLLLILYNDKSLSTPHFSQLLFCTLPVTTLYLVFVTKYLLFNKRYLDPGLPISAGYFTLSCLPIIAVHVLEWSLIIFSESVDDIFLWIAAFECFLAAYAGFYLSDMFLARGNS